MTDSNSTPSVNTGDDELETYRWFCTCGAEQVMETEEWAISNAATDHLARAHYNDDDPDIKVVAMTRTGRVVHEQYNWSASMGETVPEDQRWCRSCGAEIREERVTCPECGFVDHEARA